MLGTGGTAFSAPTGYPAGVLTVPACTTLCATFKTPSCRVDPAYADAYRATSHPDAGDGNNAPYAAAYGCPDYDAGTITVTCYGGIPYEATSCPLCRPGPDEPRVGRSADERP